MTMEQRDHPNSDVEEETTVLPTNITLEPRNTETSTPQRQTHTKTNLQQQDAREHSMEEDCVMPANNITPKPPDASATNTKRPHQTDSDSDPAPLPRRQQIKPSPNTNTARRAKKTKTTPPNRKNRTFKILYFFSFVYTFNLISVNTQGLRNVHRRQTVFNLIKQQKYDIFFFQETLWTDDLKSEILRECCGNIVFNNFEHNARGTAILFHPTIQVVIKHADHRFNLINTYAPRTNIERKYYFATISNFLSATEESILFLSATEENIVGGDLNCISNNKLDKLGGNPNFDNLQELFYITQQQNMTDIWGDRNREVQKLTWTSKNPHCNTYIHTRIDRFYISSALTTSVTKTDIIPCAFSDHDLISLTFDFNKQPRG